MTSLKFNFKKKTESPLSLLTINYLFITRFLVYSSAIVYVMVTDCAKSALNV